ncbi:hypothetical protein [Streptomyces sp. NPDC020377]|uniref:hypothetical protein n=1 Tax=Streptomyces sp. NPDC020377 TaxID=3365070 RepID=UPI0037A19F20
MMFNQSLVRVRAGERTDRGGNTVKDWSPGAVSRLAVDQVNIQPSIQQEDVDEQRNAVVTGWHVQSAEGTNPDIRYDDRIEWDGMTLEVDGEVARWPELFTDAVHHIEFEMKRATG